MEEESPRAVRVEDSMADVFRESATRLKQRAAELRTRLEVTERTQSTLEDERRRVLEELTEERRRREEAEWRLDYLRRELDALGERRETPERSVSSDIPLRSPPDTLRWPKNAARGGVGCLEGRGP